MASVRDWLRKRIYLVGVSTSFDFRCESCNQVFNVKTWRTVRRYEMNKPNTLRRCTVCGNRTWATLVYDLRRHR